MPVQVSYPGVYVVEVPSGSHTITAASTSVALLVGKVMRGRIGIPTRILSLADYERTFGTDTSLSEMTDQVRQFFLNGGQRAWIMRLANGARQATLVMKDPTNSSPVLTLTARDAGTDGNSLRAQVDYVTPSPESTFNLRVFRESVKPNGDIQVTDDETYSNLSMNPTDARFVERVVAQSSTLVDAAVSPAMTITTFPGWSMSGLVFSGTATDITTLLNGVVAPTTGVPQNKIMVQVDDSPFAIATLPAIAPLTFGAAIPEWQSAIADALAPFGKQVDVQVLDLPAPVAGFRVLVIRSRVAGGQVTIRSAPANDAAVPLQLGVTAGGAEVGGTATQRPAPTGYFADVGNLAFTAGQAPLDKVLRVGAQTGSALVSWTLTDVNGSHNGTTGLGGTNPLFQGGVFPPSGTPLATGVAGSLLNVRDNLRLVGAAIARQLPSGQKWGAQMQGLRLVLSPAFGTVDADRTAQLATSTFDVHAANAYLAGAANARALRLGDTSPASPYRDISVAGDNGAALVGSSYDDGYEVIARVVDAFNLLMLPRAADQIDDDRDQLWGPASVFAASQSAFLIEDPRSDWLTIDDVTQGIAAERIGVVKDHAAVYWPRLLVAHDGGLLAAIDPCGAVAGLMARIDSNRGVWKAPAGLEADLRGVRGVEHAMSDPDNGLINPLAVNAVRAFPSGIIVWGARTMDGFDNSGNDDYKYIPVRRLALMIESSLELGLRFAVFEPNDEPLWAQIRLAAGAFMNNLFRQGAFAGQKASDAYFVKCDSETTTQNDINLGIVNVVVGFAPLKPAEFVVITIQQMAGQVQT